MDTNQPSGRPFARLTIPEHHLLFPLLSSYLRSGWCGGCCHLVVLTELTVRYVSMLQLSQRPLSGSDADRELFVDRTVELCHLERSAQLDFNVLVLGERGMGSTSLVRQHQRRL